MLARHRHGALFHGLRPAHTPACPLPKRASALHIRWAAGFDEHEARGMVSGRQAGYAPGCREREAEIRQARRTAHVVLSGHESGNGQPSRSPCKRGCPGARVLMVSNASIVSTKSFPPQAWDASCPVLSHSLYPSTTNIGRRRSRNQFQFQQMPPLFHSSTNNKGNISPRAKFPTQDRSHRSLVLGVKIHSPRCCGAPALCKSTEPSPARQPLRSGGPTDARARAYGTGVSDQAGPHSAKSKKEPPLWAFGMR